MGTVVNLSARLRDLVQAHGSQRAAARHLGISPQYVCDLLKGRREPGPAVLKKLGLRRDVRIVVER